MTWVAGLAFSYHPVIWHILERSFLRTRSITSSLGLAASWYRQSLSFTHTSARDPHSFRMSTLTILGPMECSDLSGEYNISDLDKKSGQFLGCGEVRSL
jgi:hypothetical protein